MIDLLLHSASELVTVAGGGPKAGMRQNELGVLTGGAVAVAEGRIRFIGPSDAVCRAAEQEGLAGATVIDARGKTVLPGFVDPHTHLVFAGYREDEYERRLQGVSYLEIAAAGGGIVSTVRETRAATLEELVAGAHRRLDTMLRYGTTTVEAKSGYGLTLEDELKCLLAARLLGESHPVTIVSTFLGAHVVPPEYQHRPDQYVALIVEQMLPAVAAGDGAPLAEFCDVFCDEGAFSLDQARQILSAAQRLGLGLKIHADEFAPLGGAALAAERGALSADHLVVTPPADMAAMARRGVIAVLLPATTFHLGHSRYAPAREFIAAGVPVAIGTDLNPGTSMTESIPMAMAIACSQMKLTPAEAIVAATLNAAHAVARGAEVGSLEVGKMADLIVLDAPNYRHLAYHFGVNLVETVVKGGRIVVGG